MYNVKAPSPMLALRRKMKRKNDLKVGDMIEGKQIKAIKKAQYPVGAIMISFTDGSAHLIIDDNDNREFGP